MIISKISCPYCGAVIGLNEDQFDNSLIFICPACNQYNWGSTDRNQAGVLTGIISMDCERCGEPNNSINSPAVRVYDQFLEVEVMKVHCRYCGTEMVSQESYLTD